MDGYHGWWSLLESILRPSAAVAHRRQGQCYQYEWPSYTYIEPHAFHKCMQAIWIMCTVIISECTKLVRLSWHIYINYAEYGHDAIILHKSMEIIHTRTYLCRIHLWAVRESCTLTVNAMERSIMIFATVHHSNHAHYGALHCALWKIIFLCAYHMYLHHVNYHVLSSSSGQPS